MLLVMVAATAYAESGIATYAISDHTVEGVSPYGTSIDLFDYWTSTPEDNNYNVNGGINNGHQLKFNTGTGQNTSDVINAWVGSGNGPRTGMVMRTLQDGYPSLANTTITGWVNLASNSRNGSQTLQQESLAYLFDSSSQEGKAAHMNVGGLLQVDEDGYYYYNASLNQAKDAGGDFDSANYAAYDEESNSFTLYDSYAVYPTGSNSPLGQFFPFNPAGDVFTEQRGELTAKTMNSGASATTYGSGGNQITVPGDNGVLNHYFGLHMSTQFVQQYGGHVEENGKVVTYEFSGDDDVWIYIDGVLVGDLGGIHDAASISIDFSTGDITVKASNGSVVTPSNIRTLRDCFEAAGLDDTESWSTSAQNTFADNTYHTLDFFYLERGNNDSNMSLKYNLVSYPETDIVKVDQEGASIGGAEFELYATDDSYSVSDSATPVCTAETGADGTVTLVGEGRKIITIDSLMADNDGCTHYVLRETKVPDGYRATGDIQLYIAELKHGEDSEYALLSANQWTTGAYAMPRVTATAANEVTYTDGSEQKKVKTTGENVTMFAVVQKLEDGSWKSVYGDHLSGWTLTDDADVTGALDAVDHTNAVFQLASSGAWQVDIDQLPGDIKAYQYFAGDSAEYRVAYYYTTASSLSEADDSNTYLITNSDDFDREFSAHLYIPNTINRIAVQKLDDATGSPVNGATFALYKAEDVTVNEEDGSYSINSGATPKTGETGTLTMEEDGIDLSGAVAFSYLDEGEYYIVETAAPEGYEVNTAPVKVVVNDSGVFADAGAANDGVQVTRGIGRLVYTMAQFATDDDIDTTLRNVVATPKIGSVDGDGSIKWDSDKSKAMRLVYASGKEGTVLDYKPAETDGAYYYTIDTGIAGMSVKQDYANPSSSAQDISDTDITNLFTGTTIIQVTDAQTGDFTLSKTVKDASADETTAFTFDLSFTLDENVSNYAATLLPGDHAYTITDADSGTVESGTLTIAAQAGEGSTEAEAYVVTAVTPEGDATSSAFATNDNDVYTVSLKNGETLTIEALPVGTSISTSEQATEGYSIASITANGTSMEDAADPATAAIEKSNDGEVEDASIAYTNEKTATLALTKSVVADEGLSPDEDTVFSFKIEIPALDTDTDTDNTQATFKAQRYDASGDAEGDPFDITFTDGVATCDLKGGESVRIMGLPNGAEYTVTETGASITTGEGDDATTQSVTDAYTTSYGEGSDDSATGTLASGETSEVTVTNTYQVAKTTLNLGGFTKTLEGRNWIEGDEFSFTLSGEAADGSPEDGFTLPDSVTVTVTSSDAAKAADEGGSTEGVEVPFSFDAITFTKPGTYEFTVTEGSISAKSVSASTTAVKYEVTVTDDGAGNLKADAKLVSDETTGTAFVNTYEPSDGTAKLEATKVLDGAQLTESQFTFAIKNTAKPESIETAPMPSNAKQNDDGSYVATNAANGDIDFGTFTFDQAGTYTYEVSEVSGSATGYTYDTTVYTVTFKVTDDPTSGGFAVTESIAKKDDGSSVDAITFNNSYKPEQVTTDAKATFSGTKTVTAESGSFELEAGQFTFQMKSAAAPDDVTAPLASKADEKGCVTNDADGSFDFGTLTFTEAGTYTYEVSEVKGDVTGVSYDDTTYTLTFVVSDDDGQLVIDSQTIKNGDQDVEAGDLDFNNYYNDGTTSLTISGTKVLDNNGYQVSLEKGEFSFALYEVGADGEENLIETVTNGAPDDNSAAFSFKAISYNETGVHTYKVYELGTDGEAGSGGTKDGIVYSTQVYTVKVAVSEDDSTHGGLKVTSKIGGGEDAIVFTNSYEPTPGKVAEDTSAAFALTKKLTGRDWSADDSFTFTLTGEGNAPMPDGSEDGVKKVSVTSADAKDGVTAIDFGSITYDAEGTYTYTVAEGHAGDTIDGVTYASNTVNITVTVKDNGAGSLVASVAKTGENASGDASFVNEYSSTFEYGAEGKGGLDITKQLNGRAATAGQFSFTIAAAGENKEAAATKLGSDQVTVASVASDAGEAASVASNPFASMTFTTADSGTTFTYTIAENTPEDGVPSGYTYDSTTYTVQITPVDNGNGTMTVTTVVTNDKDSTKTETTSTSAKPQKATVAFVNSYEAKDVTVGASGSAQIEATKTLNNNILTDKQFSFSVKDATTDVEVATGTNDASGTITFSNITYTTENLLEAASDNGSNEVGKATLDTSGDADVYTFTYAVTEDELDAESSVSYNSGNGTVTVTVTDDRAGKLSVAVSYNGGKDESLAFENTYGASAKAELSLTGTKTITGVDGAAPPELESGMFSFTIEGSEGAPMPEATTVQNDGSTVSFGPITYTMENVFGTNADGVDAQSAERTKEFTYTITESGSVAGVTNDTAAKTVVVTVTDNGDGTLTAKVTKVDESATTGMDFSFVNTYSVESEESTPTGEGALTFTKVLTCQNGTRELNAGEFTFQLVDADGSVVSTGTNDDQGNVSMSAVKFTKQGTYTYTLSEAVPEGARAVEGGYELDGVTYPNTTYQVTATVTDDHKGNLDVAWSMADAEGNDVTEATIENEYHADATSVVFGAGKALEGRAVTEGEFTFQLADSEGTVLGTATNDATGRVVFANAPQTFDEVGTYEFTVSEVLPEDDDPETDGIQKDGVTYDETVYTARVVVTDDGEGNLVVSELTYNDKAELPTFTNVYTEPPASDVGTGAEAGGSDLPGTGDNSLLGIVVAAVAGIAAVAAGVVLRKRGE